MIDDRCFTFTNGYEPTLNFCKKTDTQMFES